MAEVSSVTPTSAPTRRPDAPSRQVMGRRRTVDRAMRILTWLCGLIAVVPLVWILVTVVTRGAAQLVSVEPTYTRICAVSASPDRYHEAYQRVAESQCNGGNGKYRWLMGGAYPAVGERIATQSQSVSRDPSANKTGVVVAQPTSDSAGTVRLPSLNWWTKDTALTPDQQPGGGALHAIVGTLWIGAITSVIAVPLGVLGAIYLVEYARGHRSARIVSFMIDILTGIPSIVAALFVFAVVITTLGFNRSTLAASLALVLLMLPTVLRSTEEMLKLVPDSLREASYALGVPRWKTITSVVLPTARRGIGTGIVLGMARVMGETAPLLILLNYARGLNLSPFSRTMGSLPTMISTAAALPQDYPGAARGWGAALTLILLVMGLNLIARAIGRDRMGRGRKSKRPTGAVPQAAGVAGTADDTPAGRPVDDEAADSSVVESKPADTIDPTDTAASGAATGVADRAPRHAAEADTVVSTGRTGSTTTDSTSSQTGSHAMPTAQTDEDHR